MNAVVKRARHSDLTSSLTVLKCISANEMLIAFDNVRSLMIDLEGDGAGYDILSFEPDGRERLIEVKTTRRTWRASFT